MELTESEQRQRVPAIAFNASSRCPQASGLRQNQTRRIKPPIFQGNDWRMADSSGYAVCPATKKAEQTSVFAKVRNADEPFRP